MYLINVKQNNSFPQNNLVAAPKPGYNPAFVCDTTVMS